MILRDEQIDRAVIVVVAGDDGTRVFEMNLVEADIGSDVLEAVGAQVPEQLDFALAIFCLTDGDKVDPAVVVVVEGGDAVGADPAGLGQSDALERLTVIVAPERNAGCCVMREYEIHPAVMIKVERYHAKGVCRHARFRDTFFLKPTLSRILKDRRSRSLGYRDINCTVVVVVGADCSSAYERCKAGSICNIREGAVPVIAPHLVRMSL